jgi:hypothetical protein
VERWTLLPQHLRLLRQPSREDAVALDQAS